MDVVVDELGAWFPDSAILAAYDEAVESEQEWTGPTVDEIEVEAYFRGGEDA